jgi:hypothetical protein
VARNYDNLLREEEDISQSEWALTDSMEQGPSWKGKSHSVSQEIPAFMESKDYYCVFNSPPLAPILSQMNAVHNFPPYFSMIQSNII